jgi:hypothetical protein
MTNRGHIRNRWLLATASATIFLLCGETGKSWTWVLTKGSVIALDAAGVPQARVAANASADIALSPDGSTLYVAGDSLETVEARTARVLAQSPNPDFQHWPLGAPTSLLDPSLDGKHLYMLKRHTEAGKDSSWILSYNTMRHAFDSARAPIGGDCPAPSLKVRSATQLDVVCGGHNEIFMIKLSPDGLPAGTSNWKLPPPDEPHTRGDVRATIWGPGHEVFLAKLNGRLLKVDTGKPAVIATSPLPLDDWRIRGAEGALSPDSRRLFIGCSSPDDYSGLTDHIAIFDTQSLRLIRVAKAPYPFWNLARNTNRNELLLTVPARQALVAIDQETLQELRELPLGATPQVIRFSALND